MATFQLEIVTAERLCLSKEITALVVPSVAGELSILPHHAPLMTMLQPGELLIKKDNDEMYWAVTGGFLEVRPDNNVIVLADACEQAEEIDVARAEEAKKRAEERLKEKGKIPNLDAARAEAALQRSLIRLKVAERRRRRSGPIT